MQDEHWDEMGGHTNRFGFSEIVHDEAERRSAAAANTGEGASGAAMPPDRGEEPGLSQMERRVRAGADTFQFDTLINGVASAPTPDLREAAMDARNARNGPPSQRPAAEDHAIIRSPAHPSVGVAEPVTQPSYAAASPRATRSGRARAGGLALLVAVLALAVFAAFRVGQSAAGRESVTAASSARPPAASPAPGAPAGPAADAAGSRKGLPNPSLTPGDFAPGGDRAERVPDAARRAVLHAYNIPPDDTRYVVIRLVPLVFDGTNRPANLFPTTPWFAGLKARLDKKLEEMVRQGKLTTVQAREELTSDWIRSAHKHFVRNYGLNSQNAAKQEEESLHWY